MAETIKAQLLSKSTNLKTKDVSLTKTVATKATGLAAVGTCCAVAICVVLFAGCSANSYRQSADKAAYRIVQQTERQVLGHTNAFTIDTPYSARKPGDILPDELIEDRLRTNQRVLKIEDAIELAMNNSREY